MIQFKRYRSLISKTGLVGNRKYCIYADNFLPYQQLSPSNTPLSLYTDVLQCQRPDRRKRL